MSPPQASRFAQRRHRLLTGSSLLFRIAFMGLLEKEMGRRRFLARGAGAIVGLAGSVAVGTIIVRQFEKPGTATIDPNFITEKNLIEYLPNPSEFSKVEVSHLTEVTRDSDIVNLPQLGAENRQFLLNHGIQSFSIAQDTKTDRFLVSISFLPDTKPGKLIDGSNPNPQWPAFILYGNGEVFKQEAVQTFKFYQLTKDSSMIGNFYFPVKRNQVIGEKVIVLLNNQLINVAGQDLPPFALPFLVQIESPGPFT